MKEKKEKNGLSIIELFAASLTGLVIMLFVSCLASRKEMRLDPESKEFIEKSRYIITSNEYKIFINLTPEKREAYIKEFWKRRDPYPDTERNEFKEEYMERIETANRLFGVGQAGYYTDRGMIYVLFGPPDDIHKSQIFSRREGSDREVWLYTKLMRKYPNVRLYFIDRFGTGNFELEKNSITQSVLQEVKLHYLNKAAEKGSLAFDVKIGGIEERKKGEDEFTVQIDIPYRKLWFVATDGKLETTLSVILNIKDDSGTVVKEFEEDYAVSVLEKDIEDFYGRKYHIAIPLALAKGGYVLSVTLTNRSGEKGMKAVEFRI